MSTLRMDIDLPRNGQFSRQITMEVDADTPFDLTDAVINAKAASHAGSEVIATATCTVDVGPSGTFTMTWLGSDFDAFGNLYERSIAVYDVVVVIDAVPYVPLRGAINLLPGVTS
jgi:hypothetical protein